jgi:HAD superfamily hydrolase (TIGR01450 family)
MKLAFVTNNAARTPEAVAEHLAGIGVEAAGQDVVTSAQAAARLLAARFAPGSAILVVGGEGLVAALAEHSLRAVSSAEEDPVAVVQGFHPDVGWRLLCEGAIALARGLPWIASNTDLTIPTARGLAPGNGTLVSALAVTTGRQPEVAGKPGTPLFDETVIRVGATHPIVVGDRLDTDIEGANACHVDSLLVLTGVTDLAALLAADPPRRPTYAARDLSGLNSHHRTVTWSGDQATCGRWRARVGADGVVHLARDGADEHGDDLNGGEENLDGLRAVVSAGWHHRDSRAGGGESVLDTAAAERRLGLARMSS